MRLSGLILAGLLLPATSAVWADEAQTPDEMALAFPGIIGTTRASAEICRIPVDSYKEPVEDARTIAIARYEQISSTAKDEQVEEDRAYHACLHTHEVTPSLPDCHLFYRVINNIYIWSAQQGAAFIREEHQHGSR